MDDLDDEPEAPPAVAAPHVRPLRWAIPALGVFLSGALLWQQRADVGYALSSPTAVDLGEAGAYHLERARAARYVRIAGEEAAQVNPYRRGLSRRELVPLRDVPVIVDRPAGEPPRDRFEGRLEPAAARPELRAVIRWFLEHDVLAPPGARLHTAHVWILEEGERPWRPGRATGWTLGLAALVAFNAFWLLRRLER